MRSGCREGFPDRFVGGESVVNVLPNEALGVFLILVPCPAVL